MALTYRVEQGTLEFQTDFSEPVFELLSESSAFQRQFFASLAKHGVRLSDIRLDRGSTSLGDHSIICYLFNANVSIRIRLDKVEIYCFNLAGIGSNKLSEASVDALQAVKSHLAGVSFKTHSLALGLHGKLEGTRVQEFLARFVVDAPKILGSAIGSGVVFYYGPEAERLLSSLTLDLSAVIADGLFVRVQGSWDAHKVSIEALPGIAEKRMRDSLAELGLEPVRG